MRGRPFALLGVNSDLDRDKARRDNTRRDITWRSWWDGHVHGPVAQAWQTPGLPYVVLIDHQGVIRHRGIARSEEARAIDRLLADLPPHDSRANALTPHHDLTPKRKP